MLHSSDSIANPFTHRSAAARYAAARPWFHPRVIERITAFTGLERVEAAVDVACGTGQSARALAALAERVEAIDLSAEMLAAAELSERVHYQVSPAEATPFVANTFDLATVGLAFHWFDQAAFLREMARVLKPGGWLVIYNSWFTGELAEHAAFRTWFDEAYLRRFPSPARRAGGVRAETAEPHGFTLRGEEAFTHLETMTAARLTEYLLTQSNVIAAVEQGTTPLEEAARWIIAGAEPFFNDKPGTLKFGGAIWYLQRE